MRDIEEEIKECSDCLSQDVEIVKLEDYFEVVCGECGATGCLGDTEEEAIELWNDEN